METAALIVAAGRGVRAGGAVPKQYAAVAGEALIRHTLRAFLGHPAVDGVLVAIHADDDEAYRAATAGLDLMAPVVGGASRQESVLNGLEKLAESAPDRVLIHDAARPFVDGAMIGRVLAALDEHAGAVAALPVHDTLKRENAGGTVAGTVDRAGLWRAQTPQGFRFADILAAHRQARGLGPGMELTDDAAVAEQAGLSVALVPGSEDNFKVTSADDLKRARNILSPPGADVRTGHGFDVHRFGDGDHVMLCGVRVPHDRGLVGHSDADAGLHALTDAVLGAIAGGDIGDHFPPTDPAWKDASSDVFLAHALELVRRRGGRIANVDVTLICESPRIGPHRQAMRDRVAEILALDPDRVSVKATTTEQLGFAGRGEGLAAQATATVHLGPGSE